MPCTELRNVSDENFCQPPSVIVEFQVSVGLEFKAILSYSISS